MQVKLKGLAAKARNRPKAHFRYTLALELEAATVEVEEKNLLVFRLHIHAQNLLFSLQDVALSELFPLHE